MKVYYLFIVTFFMASCGIKYHDSISGNGKVSTTEISTDTIRHIRVSDRIDLILIPSDTNRVVLKADENLHDAIDVTVENGVLKISSDKYIRLARSKEVWVYGNRICNVEAQAKATVTIRDTLVCDDFSLMVSSGAEVKMLGNFRSLRVNGNSGCDIFLEGKSDYLNITASSAADIFGFDFKATRADILASSAADVRIRILENAHLDASSAADIVYAGNPKIIDSRTTSLGDIRKSKF